MLDSFLDMGFGDDIINIAGDLINSTLAMGDGDDSVFIGGGVSNSSVSGVKPGSLWIRGKRSDGF